MGIQLLPTERGTAAPPPLFGPCLYVAKWLTISASAELLFILDIIKVLCNKMVPLAPSEV